MEEENEKKREVPEGMNDENIEKSRLEYLEIYLTKVENLIKAKQKKEIRLNELSAKNRRCFEKAILKEINNNKTIGAYTKLTPEESANVRQTMPEKIMESRFVLVAKPLEPHEVEQAREEGILLDWDSEEPCKAKARHVMKGYSEEGADEIEATTPQVTREGSLTVAQLIASHKWRLGFLDFTQAFHSGDKIQRTLFAMQPREGIPSMAPSQLLRLNKVCYGLTDGPWHGFYI